MRRQNERGGAVLAGDSRGDHLNDPAPATQPRTQYASNQSLEQGKQVNARYTAFLPIESVTKADRGWVLIMQQHSSGIETFF